jgi:hypothetical protein
MVHGTIKVALPENGVACPLAEGCCSQQVREVKVVLWDAA